MCTYLDKRAHIGKVRVHGTTMWKILVHPLHQLCKAAKCHDLWKAHTHLKSYSLSHLCISVSSTLPLLDHQY